MPKGTRAASQKKTIQKEECNREQSAVSRLPEISLFAGNLCLLDIKEVKFCTKTLTAGTEEGLRGFL